VPSDPPPAAAAAVGSGGAEADAIDSLLADGGVQLGAELQAVSPREPTLGLLTLALAIKCWRLATKEPEPEEELEGDVPHAPQYLWHSPIARKVMVEEKLSESRNENMMDVLDISYMWTCCGGGFNARPASTPQGHWDAERISRPSDQAVSRRKGGSEGGGRWAEAAAAGERARGGGGRPRRHERAGGKAAGQRLGRHSFGHGDTAFTVPLPKQNTKSLQHPALLRCSAMGDLHDGLVS
jgi:hypothetical protein